MSKYLFGDLVREVKEKVDRQNNPYEFFIAGDHMDTDELHLLRRGTFAGSDVGPAFIRIFKPGQVLYGSRRTYLRKVAVADFEGVTANTTFVLDTKDESILHQRLLPFIMQSERFVQHSIKRSKGSTNPYVLFSDLCDYEVDLPDIETQKRLAEILWAIDEVKMAYKRLIAATDELVKSQFIEMFGDPLTNPMGWPTEGLSSLGELARGVSKARPRNRPELLGGSYPLVQTGEITNSGVYIKNYENTYSEAGLAQSKLWPKDTLCITIAANIGQTGILAFDACFPDSVVGFISDGSVEQIFMHFYFTFFQKTLESQATQVAQKNINLKLLSDLQVIVPPLPLQKQFSAFVRQSDKSKFELEQALSELTATYKRIISEQLG